MSAIELLEWLTEKLTNKTCDECGSTSFVGTPVGYRQWVVTCAQCMTEIERYPPVELCEEKGTSV